jgi:hypothetical protein
MSKGMQQTESQTAVGARFCTRLAVDERGTDSIPVVHSGDSQPTPQTGVSGTAAGQWNPAWEAGNICLDGVQ